MTTSFFRRTLAGVVLAGGLVAGTAGLAAADTGTGTTGTTPKPTTEQICQRAKTTWDRLVALDQTLHQHYRKLVALRDKAQAAGHTELAEKLTERLDRVRDRHERIEAHLKALHDKAVDRCTLPEATTTPLES